MKHHDVRGLPFNSQVLTDAVTLIGIRIGLNIAFWITRRLSASGVMFEKSRPNLVLKKFRASSVARSTSRSVNLKTFLKNVRSGSGRSAIIDRGKMSSHVRTISAMKKLAGHMGAENWAWAPAIAATNIQTARMQDFILSAGVCDSHICIHIHTYWQSNDMSNVPNNYIRQPHIFFCDEVTLSPDIVT